MQFTRAYIILTSAVTLENNEARGGESIIKIKTITVYTYTLLNQMCFGRIIRVEMCATMLYYSTYTVDFVFYRPREKNKI